MLLHNFPFCNFHRAQQCKLGLYSKHLMKELHQVCSLRAAGMASQAAAQCREVGGSSQGLRAVQDNGPMWLHTMLGFCCTSGLTAPMHCRGRKKALIERPTLPYMTFTRKFPSDFFKAINLFSKTTSCFSVLIVK